MVENGVPLRELGVSFTGPVRLELPKPEKTKDCLRVEVIQIDYFGNTSSNIRAEHLDDEVEQKENNIVHLKGIEIKGMVNTFGERRFCQTFMHQSHST